MKEIEFQDIMFYNPVYKNYLASKCGQILSLKRNKKRILKLQKISRGYFYFQLCKNNSRKNYLVSRFVYECFKGEILVDKEVDHIDNNKENNNITNLQLLSPKENIRKSKCKKVISLNIVTKEEKNFESITEAGEFYDIFSTNISKNCQKKIKTSKSKKDGMKYQFFYLLN